MNFLLFFFIFFTFFLSSYSMRMRTPLIYSKGKNPSLSLINTSSFHFLAASSTNNSLSKEIEASQLAKKNRNENDLSKNEDNSSELSNLIKQNILLKTADVLSFYSNILLCR